MSLIARQKRHRLTRQLNVRVSPDVMDRLTDYCRFIDSSRNYVVEAALTRTFRADRLFHEWRMVQEATREKASACSLEGA